MSEDNNDNVGYLRKIRAEYFFYLIWITDQ